MDLRPGRTQVAAQRLQISDLEPAVIRDDDQVAPGSVDRTARRSFSLSDELASMFTSFLAGVIANETAPGQIDPGRRKAVFASPCALPGLGRTLSGGNAAPTVFGRD